jgi:hypothetical protein
VRWRAGEHLERIVAPPATAARTEPRSACSAPACSSASLVCIATMVIGRVSGPGSSARTSGLHAHAVAVIASASPRVRVDRRMVMGPT